MPWRKVYRDELSMTEKGQRAYEVCPISQQVWPIAYPPARRRYGVSNETRALWRTAEKEAV